MDNFWIGFISSCIPAIFALAAYTVRIEIKLARIANDISWIKGKTNTCPLRQGDHTQQAG